MKSVTCSIKASGHKNILAKHNTTWQLTKEDYLTKRGDCIIGINATHGSKDLPIKIKEYLKTGKKILISIKVNNDEYRGYAYGHPDLSLKDPQDMVFRKSEYICDRTVAIKSSFTASEIPRPMIEALKQQDQIVEVMLSTL